jgi:hypothetical protein
MPMRLVERKQLRHRPIRLVIDGESSKLQVPPLRYAPVGACDFFAYFRQFLTVS